MGNGSCAPLAAALAGDVLRAAAYALWIEARELRWVCKGIRTIRECATGTASSGRRSA
jgi:hypothetical protein